MVQALLCHTVGVAQWKGYKNRRHSVCTYGENIAMSSVVKEETRRITLEVNQYRAEKMGRLKNLDLFILDNSIRESTVGQLRSHTVENKKAIFAEVKKCGLEHIIVASFSHMTRVDDDFCQYLVDSGDDFTNLSFSEVTKGLKSGRYGGY